MGLHTAKFTPADFVILVVDDRAEQRYVRSRTLQREGYTIIEASSGAEALRLVASKMPHLVLLDVKLPDIDGIEVCRRIKDAQSPSSMVLVLHISAHMTSLQDRLRALDSGADGYLIQPVEMEEMVAVVRSLLRLHQAESALKEIALQWKASFDAISDGICLIDRTGAILRHNNSLPGVLERDGENLTGQSLADLIGLDPFELSANDSARTELMNGSRWLQLSINPSRDSDDQLNGLVCVLADITGRKAAEKMLAQARNEAEAANRAKSTFLAAASHDLRQPLQAMGLFHDLLKNEITTEAQAEYLRHMREGMQSLDSMLSVLMDVSTLEAGAIKPNIRLCRVDELLRRIADEHAGQARSKGISISARTCAALVETDLVLLERMIRNLVANALRYTENGRILLSCRSRGPKVLIQVWDTGIGIEQGNLGRIFDDYYQVNNGERDRSKGIGMGLPIVARMARLLNHQVQVRSQEGRGSVFTITADKFTGRIEDVSDAPQNQVGISGLLVAVVEDDYIQLQGLQALLESWGCRVQGATSAAATETAFDTRPDVIVTDYRLPDGVSGLDLGVKLRKSFGRDIPVVLQTGDTDPQLAKRAEQQNIVILHKPYAPERLRELLGRLALAGAD